METKALEAQSGKLLFYKAWWCHVMGGFRILAVSRAHTAAALITTPSTLPGWFQHLCFRKEQICKGLVVWKDPFV